MKNDTSKKKDLVVYPFVEWLVGDYHEELIYRNILNLYNRFSYGKGYQGNYS